MRKILHFDSPREQYSCDASVVSCFDNRFEAVNRKLLKHIGVSQPDPIRIAGGAKSLASPDEEFYRTFVVEQIRKSMRLHNTRRTLLILHSDCGAYGGLAAGFAGDTGAEFAHHRAELRRATAFLRDAIPELLVQSFFLNFEGAWIIEEQASALS
jgi:hypothetical protein